MKINSLRHFAAVIAVAFLPTVFAGPVDEAQALMERGQFADALRALDQHLAKNPQDAEARFARGLTLTKLNRGNEAIRVFADLTRDYPQLPEPYNNLAVLYAQQGDYEKARDALEAALATHPSYATAHENLGDIYSALAGASYNRALLLDQANQVVRNKLNLIGQLDRSVSDPLTTVTTPPPRAAAAAAPVAAPAAPVVAAAAAPAAAVDAPTMAAVGAVVQSWAASWSAQDVPTYLMTYGSNFRAEGGLTREAWEAQRRDRIARPQRIDVRVVNPVFTAAADGAVRVTFTQQYQSDNFSDSVTKILELKQDGDNWKIVREYTR